MARAPWTVVKNVNVGTARIATPMRGADGGALPAATASAASPTITRPTKNTVLAKPPPRRPIDSSLSLMMMSPSTTPADREMRPPKKIFGTWAGMAPVTGTARSKFARPKPIAATSAPAAVRTPQMMLFVTPSVVSSKRKPAIEPAMPTAKTTGPAGFIFLVRLNVM